MALQLWGQCCGQTGCGSVLLMLASSQFGPQGPHYGAQGPLQYGMSPQTAPQNCPIVQWTPCTSSPTWLSVSALSPKQQQECHKTGRVSTAWKCELCSPVHYQERAMRLVVPAHPFLQYAHPNCERLNTRYESRCGVVSVQGASPSCE